jgi:hypothetical protein
MVAPADERGIKKKPVDSGEKHASVRLHGVLAWVDLVVLAGEGRWLRPEPPPPTLGGVAWKELSVRSLTLVSGVLRSGLLPGDAFVSYQRLACNEQHLKSA